MLWDFPGGPVAKTSQFPMQGAWVWSRVKYFSHLMGRADSEKDPDAGKDWRLKEKGAAEDEMIR